MTVTKRKVKVEKKWESTIVGWCERV